MQHGPPPPGHHPHHHSYPQHVTSHHPHHPHHQHSVPPIYSKRKCVPLKTPIPSKFQGDIEQMKHVKIPDFASLVNFPYYMSSSSTVNKNNQGNNNGAVEGYRNCVMCGRLCSRSVMRKFKKCGKNNDNNSPR